MSPSISTLGERELIARLQQRVSPPPAHVRIGIGDDAAVIAPARNMDDVVTTDSLVEGVHFRRDWSTAEAIGHKALAVNLSDLAAMGATPRASLLSLALPADFPLADFDALLDGYLALSAASGAVLVGGNLTRSPGPLIVDVTALGSVGHRHVLTRTGARKGDELYVTGTIGAAAAGLAMLQAGRDRERADDAARSCLERYERPEPRLRCGRIVGRTRAASAAIDLSDGFSDAAWRLAEGGNVGLVVDAAALPVAAGARAWAREASQDAVDFAMGGGEDYEIAFAVPARRRSRFRAAVRRCSGLTVTRVGVFGGAAGVWLERDGAKAPLPRAGFAHF
jgi:thiamine-monophosphate kinase